MKSHRFGKLQLNRETLRNLNSGELQQVMGAIGSNMNGCTDGCNGNSNASDCAFACQQTASCECNGGDWGTYVLWTSGCAGLP